jgi:segregation and condensation protein A
VVVVVARFLALLELFREGLVGFDQVAPLGELTVRWAGGDDDTADALRTDYDDVTDEDVTHAGGAPAAASDPQEVPA